MTTAATAPDFGIRTIEELRRHIGDPDRTKRDVFGFEFTALGIFDSQSYQKGHEHEAVPLTRENVIKELREYMEFAFGKAIDHRGISASRSVQKIRAWLWILRDEQAIAFASDDKNYPNYGVPILKYVAARYGFPIPQTAKNWADGQPCRPGCEEGCGQ